MPKLKIASVHTVAFCAETDVILVLSWFINYHSWCDCTGKCM